jgi:hypothetical protein
VSIGVGNTDVGQLLVSTVTLKKEDVPKNQKNVGFDRTQLSLVGDNFSHRSIWLTFFSDSIHLLMATTEDPVRSLSVAIASLINTIVVMFVFSQK